MEDKKKERGSWFAGLKSEFGKIIWLDKLSLTKQTIAVIIVTVILAFIIVGIDSGTQWGFDYLVDLFAESE